MKYVLDTNIVIQLVRGGVLAEDINQRYQLFKPDNRLFVSIVSIGEIYAFAYKNKWGKRKIEQVESVLAELYPIPIDNREIAKVYAEIDAFSQNKHDYFSMPSHISARNMGKNDLWIAATTYILAATLLTTAKDFLHLHGVFFDVECVEI